MNSTADDRRAASRPTRGACLCGAVTFAIEPPYRWLAHCHCSMCRKQHGTLFSTGVGVTAPRFRWLSGAEHVVHFRATEAFERPFCRHCGSTVPGISHLPDVLHVPAGLLEGDPGIRPRAHIFVGSKAPFHTITDALMQFQAYPAGIDLPSVDRPQAAGVRGGIAGSCLCGGVGYEIDAAPQRIVNCYCSLCRRSRGTAFASTFFTSPAKFRWTRGRGRIRAHRLPAPRTYETDFCVDCGSIVPTVVPDVSLALVPAGGVDTPLAPLPSVHIHVASKAPWYDITDAGPQYAEMPPPERFGELFF